MSINENVAAVLDASHEDQIRAHMIRYGIKVPPRNFIADGKWQRFAPDPDRKGQSASYRIVPDPIAPMWLFRDWRIGGSLARGNGTSGRKLSPEETAAWNGRMAECRRRALKELEEIRQIEALRAAERWERANPAQTNHEYLRCKRVESYGLRIEDGCLLVPLRDIDGKLWSLLRIFPDGFKMNQEFARAAGCFYVVGEIGDDTKTICICEGYATAATVREATGVPAVSACYAGNLEKVALALRGKYPNVQIIVCGDDDWMTQVKGKPHNTGKIAAKRAAKAVGGVAAFPEFGLGRPKGDTDFNDQFRRFGGLDVDPSGKAREDGLQRVKETLLAAWNASRNNTTTDAASDQFPGDMDLDEPRDDDDGDLEGEGSDDAPEMPEFDFAAVVEEAEGKDGQKISLKKDFYAYMPQNKFIFAPARDLWNKGSIVDRFGETAPEWLAEHRPVEQMTWAPGDPVIIKNRLIKEGGWFEHKGVSVFNLYLPPKIEPGNSDDIGPWIEHLMRIYPDDADHIIPWLAHRRQRPQEKINHALVLGGEEGIGKDTILMPAVDAVGPWNFQDATPAQVMGRFNGFLKSVILRISEARDTEKNKFDRFDFYEHTKTMIAAPPDAHRVDEKNMREHYVVNVCGVIITTNNKINGLYIPTGGRRHYVAWSNAKKEDFSDDYWVALHGWYAAGGIWNVVAYLDAYDLSGFNPKAPPPRTAAFWEIVNSNRSTDESEFADVLDAMARPDLNRSSNTEDRFPPKAVTLEQVRNQAQAMKLESFVSWLNEPKNRKAIAHRFDAAGYLSVNNDVSKQGLWVINGRRQTVYALSELSIKDRSDAVVKLVEELNKRSTYGRYDDVEL